MPDKNEKTCFLFPFPVMSAILAVFGGAMILIAVIVGIGYHDMRACWLNLTIGAVLSTIALIMRVKLSKYSL